MPFASLGKKRDQLRAVPCTGKIYHGFLTKDLGAIGGVSEGDITALGQKTLAEVPNTHVVVSGQNAPLGARFRKKLGNGIPVLGTQGSVSSYGNGTGNVQVATAAAAGWRLTKPVRLITVRDTVKSAAVGVTLANGLIYVQSVPKQYLSAEVKAALGLIYAPEFKSAERARSIRASKQFPPSSVYNIDPTTGATKTLPCSHDKIADAAEIGWYSALDVAYTALAAEE